MYVRDYVTLILYPLLIILFREKQIFRCNGGMKPKKRSLNPYTEK